MGIMTLPPDAPADQIVERTFGNTGELFSAFYAAQQWAENRGLIVGQMQARAPIGLHRESEAYNVLKWRGMTAWERRGLDGCIVWPDGDPRNGSAKIRVRRDALPEAVLEEGAGS